MKLATSMTISLMRINLLALLLLSTIDSSLSTLFAQGSLTPPDAPAPTMKTLNQIEPRTPIGAGAYVISSPGSYYLTTNIVTPWGTNGIVINADNVTLDLNGFVLDGGVNRNDSSTHGISASAACRNIRVRNGTISNWGHDGISGALMNNSQFEDLVLTDNGYNGLLVGDEARIWRCAAVSNGVLFSTTAGIRTGERADIEQCMARCNYTGLRTGNSSTVRNSATTLNQSAGIWLGTNSISLACSACTNLSTGITYPLRATVRDCVVNGNAGVGLIGGAEGVIERCTMIGNTNFGIWIPAVSSNCTVRGCILVENQRAGIFVQCDRNTIIGNSISSSGGGYDGIYVYGSQNHIEGNTLTANSGGGINCLIGTNNVICRNIAIGNPGGNYALGSNDAGPVGSASTATSPWANISR